MPRTVKATIDENGVVHLLGAVHLTTAHRALVIILEEPALADGTALLSEAALAEDWNRPEEDVAWSHLQPASL